MPAGPQSLVTLAASNYGTQTASAYKCTIDANESIVSQPAAVLCVYPTAPASLAVMVDISFSLVVPGTGWALQQTSPPLQVNLTAPGSNSYYGCIYWDSNTNTCGVVYGASGASPVPQLPNFAHQIPLALVLLSAGQLSVTGGITDIRSWIQQKNSIQSVSGTVTAQGFGLNRLSAIWAPTAASQTLTIANLAYGCDIRLLINTGTAGGAQFLNCTTPDGVVIPTFWANRVGNSAAKIAWNASTSKTWTVTEFFPLDGFWIETPGTGSPFLLFS